ncbi:dTMP kinase [Tepidibacter thalassicus]|uniref:Thymidylate kinase n=1 Tax=Tepidibacter thalassicus DSM 15285 TaxID=1123350 RepID=A0A1M5TJF3_9FIRM|nr:dTMP kinase [Tepidibacter thalassicus]SHH50834.1 thymidylate kinase [Tepidibacter thalassicus DSM 15285]
MKGLFITIEGPDGSGKSTQIKLLKEYLENKGYDVVLTREPGGTHISEKIRDIILDKENKNMHPKTEALLYAASRAQHVEERIKPALNDGKIVICDRFVDSSIVYQGLGRNLGIKNVYDINLFAMGDIIPDFTLLFDIDMSVAKKRKENRGDLDRLESEEDFFHKQVFKGYKKLKNLYPDRIKVVKADDSIEEVHERIINIIDEFLER